MVSSCQGILKRLVCVKRVTSLWTIVVQSLVVICRDPVDICPVGFPNMGGADDFDRDAKGGKPSEELGAHRDIHMGMKVLVIHRHDHNVLPEAVDDDADKIAASF